MPEWSSGFPYFLQFNSELVNKEFMIWATINSWSCLCWLYRASPSKGYNQYDFSVGHLVMSMCSLLLCCWEWVFAMTSAFSWQNSISLCPASVCTPWSNLPVIPGVSALPTFAFQSPIMKRTSFLGVLKGLVGLRRTIQLQPLQCYWFGHRLGLPWYRMVCLGNEQRSFCHFWNCTQVLHFGLFCWLWWLLHFF